MSLNYSIGTATQYDNLPLLPAIGTLNGGIRLNSNISMAVGSKLEFDGLKFIEASYASAVRIVVDSRDSQSPRFGALIDVNTPNMVATANSTIATQVGFATTSFVAREIGGHTVTANLGAFFARGSDCTLLSRAISRQFRVK